MSKYTFEDLEKICSADKWIEMKKHYDELLVISDVTDWWQEQFNICNRERELLKKGFDALNAISEETKIYYRISFDFKSKCYVIRMMGKTFMSKFLPDAMLKCVKYVSNAENLL